MHTRRSTARLSLLSNDACESSDFCAEKAEKAIVMGEAH